MVETQPLITTLIPTCDRPRLLRRAVQSALDQTFFLNQVVILDNASQEETHQVALSFQKKTKRVTYYRHSKKIAAVDNFQWGLARVKTPFYSFLADDDYLAPPFYARALTLLARHPEAGFFIGSTLDVRATGEVLYATARKWPDQEYYDAGQGALHVIKNYINWTGTLFRTQATTLLTLDPRIKVFDLDWVIRLAARSPFVFSKTTCAYFVRHEQGYSTQAGLKLIWPSYLILIDNAKKAFPQKLWKRAHPLLNQRLRRLLFSVGSRSILQGLPCDSEPIRALFFLRLLASIVKICPWLTPFLRRLFALCCALRYKKGL